MVILKQLSFIIFFLLASLTLYCQTKSDTSIFNFDFEKIQDNYPLFWDISGSPYYKITVDSIIMQTGKYSVAIEYSGTSSDFKSMSFKIPGSYEGKQVTLSGLIKTENVSDGWAGLWMRIDPKIAFDNMQKRGITGTTEWQRQEITLDLIPSLTKQIVVGGLLVGKGKMWLDDLRITIDGKDIREMEPSEGSKIDSINLTEWATDNLGILGKVWGFLQYYHPSVAKGNYNWDYELFRMLPKVLATKSQNERNNVLTAWIDTLGNFEFGNPQKIEGEVKIYPDLSWIDSSVLGEKLARQLIDIKNAKRAEESHYIGLDPGNKNPVFKNEEPYANFAYPNAGFRLLSLFRYWNIIQYYFPYKNLIEENWNNVIREFVPQFVNASNELEYKNAVLLLIARVQDTHANIWGADFVLEKYRGLNYAPVVVSFIENKAVVTGYHDDMLGAKSGLKIGDVVEKINNKQVRQIVNERLPFTPASNYPTQLRDIAANLLRTNDSVLTLKYMHDDIRMTQQIECYSSDKMNIYAKDTQQDTCLKIINNDIAYLNPGYLSKQGLSGILSEILKSRGLIIDLRRYPSAFIVDSLSEFLLPEETSFVKISSGSITSPGLFTITYLGKVGKHNQDYYRGKVVIIVNDQTQSSGEYHTMAFQTAPRAIVIGSTTAGADGNVSRFYLPGGILTMISGLGIYYPDGRETQRVGIVPDIEVKPTIRGIKEGRDELLEKAIEIINND